MSFNFNDPLLLQLRSGKSDDPFASKQESRKIINNVITLSEIPDEFTKVSITGYFETKKITPASNEFYVNYQNGIITFNSSEDGKTVQATYMGRGIIQYPAERIYAHTKDKPDVMQNLQEIIDNGQQGIDALSQMSDMTQAESGRVSAESGRVSAENQRVTAEGTRNTNENNRQSQETSRQTNETTRTSAESSRVTTENNRVSTETSRVNAETSRASAESARVTTENTRISNESTRQSQEASRQTNTTNAITAANTATSNANTAADNANTKATLADQKATLADQKATLAQSATDNANTATTNANTARDAANTAATNANDATSAANTAKVNADTATANANQATTNANNAASSASNLVTTFVSKGQYDSATAYVPNNTVLYNGSSWRCLKNTTGNAPAEGTTWTLVASKGMDGSGSGTVLSVTSANSDISIINTTTNPVLTLNGGTGANKILKLDSSGKAPVSIITEDSTHRFVTDVEKSTWNGKTGSRATTFVVAASNSTTKGQAGADYVCDGVSDQTEINNAFLALPIIVWESGTATAGASTTITLATTRAGDGMNWYVGYTIAITSGTGSGQSRFVMQYDSSTNLVTVDSAWTTIPDTTSVYELRSKYGKVILLEGLFNISATISVPTNCALEGQGDATLLKPPNGNATGYNIISGDSNGVASGISHIVIQDLKIDGNKSNSTATQYGISLSKGSYCTIQRCTIHSMRNGGIYTQNVGGVGVYGNKFLNNVVFGCATVGISANGNNHIFQGNIVSYNGTAGISHSTGSGLVFNGNVVTANTANGISLVATTNSVVSANTVIGTKSGNGIKADFNSDNNTITANTCNQNEYHGIYILSGSNNTINGNTCTENSQSATTTYDNICLGGGNTNNIQVNTCRQGALTNKPRYGINVSATACTGNLITNNDLTTGGATGAFADSGTSTITTAGNKVA